MRACAAWVALSLSCSTMASAQDLNRHFDGMIAVIATRVGKSKSPATLAAKLAGTDVKVTMKSK